MSNPILGMPEGWAVERVDHGAGWLVRSPRVNGVCASTAVFTDDEDPAHRLLAMMLTASAHTGVHCTAHVDYAPPEAQQPVAKVFGAYELKQCPFCDGEAVEDWSGVSEFYGHDHQQVDIECSGCHATISISTSCSKDGKATAGYEFACSCHNDIGAVARARWNARVVADKGEVRQQEQPAVMQATMFEASNGEYRNPFYEGQFDSETKKQSDARRHWATAATEIAIARHRLEAATESYTLAVDDGLVSTHLGVASPSDDLWQAKAKLQALIHWHVSVATDPAVNGGYMLVPVEPTPSMLAVAVSSPPSSTCPTLAAGFLYSEMLRVSPKMRSSKS